MRKLSLVAFALLACSSSAFAADLATKSPMPAPYAPPSFNWTGWYVGAGGGFIHGELSGPGVAFAQNTNGTAGFFAVEGGYRYQLPVNIVLGFDVTAPVWTASVTQTQPFAPAAPTTVAPQFVVLPTVQLGYALGSWLPYVGVGVGAASIKVTTTTGGLQPSDTETSSVFDFSLGLDYALNQNWIIGVRYDHLIVEETTYKFAAGGGFVAPALVGATTDGVMGSVKFKF